MTYYKETDQSAVHPIAYNVLLSLALAVTVSDRPSPHPPGIHILVEDTDKQMTMQWGNLVTVGHQMPWEQEAGTPNPNCTLQRRQCERWEESVSQGSQTVRTSVAGSARGICTVEQGKVRELQYGREGRSMTKSSQIKQALDRQGFTILSIRFSRTLKHQQNQVWLHVRQCTSESFTL